jgi:DNA adenine methylase
MGKKTLNELVKEGMENKLSSVQSFPLVYVGSKWNLAPFIIKFMKEHDKYCEVFGGCAAVLLRKKPVKIEVYNDLYNDLVNVLIMIKTRCEDLIKEFDKYPLSRVIYERFREDLKKEELPNERVGFDFERAFKWLFCNVRSFIVVPVYRLPNSRFMINFEYTLRDIAYRLKRVVFEHKDFEDCLRDYSKTDFLFYLDPPYWGLNYYAVKFTKEDHLRLYNILKEIKNPWILSYNADKEVVELYKGFFQVKIDYRASVYHGKIHPRYQELLIFNYKPDGLKDTDRIEVIDEVGMFNCE